MFVDAKVFPTPPLGESTVMIRFVDSILRLDLAARGIGRLAPAGGVLEASLEGIEDRVVAGAGGQDVSDTRSQCSLEQPGAGVGNEDEIDARIGPVDMLSSGRHGFDFEIGADEGDSHPFDAGRLTLGWPAVHPRSAVGGEEPADGLFESGDRRD